MPKLSLHYRLLISHLLVVALGLLSATIIRELSFSHLFSRHLDLLQANGVLLDSAREVLLKGFDSAWTISGLLGLAVGAVASVTFSYWVARRINHALVEVEQVTYRLATGHLKDRVPISPIPELARLGRSINQMVNALEDAEQRRSEMVTDLSHELRTPLTVIRGYLEEIDSDRLQETPEVRGLLIKETRRLERLVNNLQDLSKAESGSLHLRLKPVSLKPLLTSVVERFDGQLLEEGPMLRLACPASLPRAWADSDHTEQILVNLLGNAIRHTQQGQVVLSATAENDRIWLSVSDTGIGISAVDLPHVFDRFWRSAQSRSHHSAGTGVGLTIARQLVELQGGQISVESQLGQGTTFKFWLPVAPGNARSV